MYSAQGRREKNRARGVIGKDPNWWPKKKVITFKNLNILDKIDKKGIESMKSGPPKKAEPKGNIPRLPLSRRPWFDCVRTNYTRQRMLQSNKSHVQQNQAKSTNIYRIPCLRSASFPFRAPCLDFTLTRTDIWAWAPLAIVMREVS